VKKVVISGAGLVGSFLALMMKKRGHDVYVFEKRDDMRKADYEGGRSINLVATSRALNAFQKAGIKEDVLDITVPVYGRMMHSREGELTYQPYGRDRSECNYSVSRSLLNVLLMNKAEEAGVKFNFEKTLSSLDFENNIAHFDDEISFDLFFGADGAGSQTRKEMLRVMPDASESVDFIDSDYKELFMPAGEKGEYVIDKDSLHIWPRGHHMLMALPNLAGSFTITAYLPKKGDDSFDNLKNESDVLEFFKSEYGDSVSLMPGFEKEYFENPQGRLGTVRMSKWNYKGSVALVGDAAHSIVPFFGQGMNCGMEDCSVIGDLIDEHGDDFEKIFEAYDQHQRPNGNAIADMALDNFIEMQKRVGDPKFLLKKKVEQILEKEYPDKYRSRYGLVMYTLTTYAEAQRIGEVQSAFLDDVVKGVDNIEDVDHSKLKQFIHSSSF